MQQQQKDLHFWTIKYWINEPGLNHHGFDIWVSPKFVCLSTFLCKTLSIDKLEEEAKALVITAGYDVTLSGMRYTNFDRNIGLVNISVPGNACGLDLDIDNSMNYRDEGYNLIPHNVDTPLQQTTLLGIWLLWAKYVEATI